MRFAIVAALGLMLCVVAGCGQPPLESAAQSNARIAAATTAIDAAAADGHAAATQAAGLVRDAKTTVDANVAATPSLQPASNNLRDALPQIELADGKLIFIRTQTKIQQVESPKLKADLAAAQTQYDALRNWWPVRFALWCRAAFWTLVWVSAGLAVLMILGSMYGVPAATRPIFSSVGAFFEGVGAIAYKASLALWSAIPFGRWIDDGLDWLGGVLRIKPKVTTPAAT